MPITGGQGIVIDYDCSAATEPLYVKCDILDAAYKWFGYNVGDPNEISGKGKLALNIELATPLESGTTYSASSFVVSQAKYKSLVGEEANNAFKFCVNGEWPISQAIVFGGGDTKPTPTDPCDANPCQNGGTCTSTTTTFSCACPPTHSGSTCLTKKPVSNPCSSSPCSPDATCTASGTQPICECKEGFVGTGKSCTAKPVDEPEVPEVPEVTNACAVNNGGCPTGASCTLSAATAVCKCPTTKPATINGACKACASGTTWSATSKKCVSSTPTPDPDATNPDTENPTPDLAPAQTPTSSSNTTLIVVIVILVVLAVAAGAFLWYRSRQTDGQKYAMQFMNTTQTGGGAYSTNPYPPAPPANTNAARPPPPPGAPQYGRPYGQV